MASSLEGILGADTFLGEPFVEEAFAEEASVEDNLREGKAKQHHIPLAVLAFAVEEGRSQEGLVRERSQVGTAHQEEGTGEVGSHQGEVADKAYPP